MYFIRSVSFRYRTCRVRVHQRCRGRWLNPDIGLDGLPAAQSRHHRLRWCWRPRGWRAAETMDGDEVRAIRAANQRLHPERGTGSAADVVRHLVAVQAQDMAAAAL